MAASLADRRPARPDRRGRVGRGVRHRRRDRETVSGGARHRPRVRWWALSRVATGVHYPSDVLAGTAIGAAAGVLTLRWWPRRPLMPAMAVRPPRQAPRAPAGEGLVLLVNTSAGTASSRLASWLAAELPKATVIETDAGQDLLAPAAPRRSGSTDTRRGRRRRHGPRRVGDRPGNPGLPLLVVPHGAFNHFAADLGVRSARDALVALRVGEAVLVDVGHQQLARAVRQYVEHRRVRGPRAREARTRGPARQARSGAGAWRRPSGSSRCCGAAAPHELILDGQTPTTVDVFHGNCRYEPQGTAPVYRRISAMAASMSVSSRPGGWPGRAWWPRC